MSAARQELPRHARESAPEPDPAPETESTPDFVVDSGKGKRPVVAPIDTTAPEEGVQWIPFDVREFENRNAPLMFLDNYTQKSNGYPMIRCKLIWRAVSIQC